MNPEIGEITTQLRRAEKERIPIPPLTLSYPKLSASDAYAIQLELVRQKVRAGEEVAGRKIGLTSRAMQQMLGLFEPDYGHLFKTMQVPNGGTVPVRSLIQPKIEGEIAFVLQHELGGPGITLEDVVQATKCVVPALEIIDSRIRNWEIRAVDTVADNGSSALFVLGDQRSSIQDRDLCGERMTLRRNQEVVVTGTGDTVMGSPAACVAWLANKLAEFGVRLQAGEVILSGSIGKAVDVRPGDLIRAEFDGLGSVEVSFA